MTASANQYVIEIGTPRGRLRSEARRTWPRRLRCRCPMPTASVAKRLSRPTRSIVSLGTSLDRPVLQSVDARLRPTKQS
jgi:hypothetical protein